MFGMSIKKECNNDIRRISKRIEGPRKNAGTSDPIVFNNPLMVRSIGPYVYMWE